jgi:hypothetical protein
MLFKNKKLMALIIKVRKTKGRINLFKEIPADFTAAISYFSERFPKAIMEDSKTPIGSAVGVTWRQVYAKNLRM